MSTEAQLSSLAKLASIRAEASSANEQYSKGKILVPKAWFLGGVSLAAVLLVAAASLSQRGNSQVVEDSSQRTSQLAAKPSHPSCDAMVINYDEAGYPFIVGSRKNLGLSCQNPITNNDGLEYQERAGFPDQAPDGAYPDGDLIIDYDLPTLTP